ncbi:MAG TPA: hypothetical protein DCX07_15795 [Phycisphaerales bacterium]|nr:hypothetical protein [Phycisphaerales bacterium]
MKVVWLLLLFCGSLRAAEVAVVNDDFNDGDMNRGTVWEAVASLGWYNPYTIEKMGDKFWAGCRKSGNVGTEFRNPARPGWGVLVDARQTPMKVSFLAWFARPIHQDRLNLWLIGTSSRLSLNIYPDGGGDFGMFEDAPSKKRFVDNGMHMPPIAARTPVRVELQVGGADGLVIWFDGKEVYRLAAEHRAAVAALVRDFRVIGFTGTHGEPTAVLNIPLAIANEAILRFTDVKVSGVIEMQEVPAQAPVKAPAKTATILAGEAVVLAGGLDGLPANGWKAETIFKVVPFNAKTWETVQKRLKPDALGQTEWVVLYDWDVRELGWETCLRLREYVRAGGKLMILGGARTLGRGGYFSSPLAECLPVVGKDGPDTFMPVSKQSQYEYVLAGAAAQDARQVSAVPLVMEKKFGEGRVRVLMWATLGKPKQPFWQDGQWLANLLQ